ncbi:MAG: hypothetical protein WA981_03150 [Glaciecola sp.]
MNRNIPSQCILLIAILLFSQLSNAFVLSAIPQMQECDMDMASMPNNSAQMDMNCCDTSTTVVCCDTDCDCYSFVASGVFIHHSLNASYVVNKHTPMVYHKDTPLRPYLHQPKRPPIRLLS